MSEQAVMSERTTDKAFLLSTSLNPHVHVRTIPRRFTLALLEETIEDTRLDLPSYDLMVDCSDNAPTRYLLSDLAVANNITLVSGGAVGLEGWVGVWNLPAQQQAKSAGTQLAGDQASSPRGPCLRCIYPQAQHDNSGNCEDDGILGTVVGTIGILMANEAIKLLVGLHGETRIRLLEAYFLTDYWALQILSPA